MNRMPLVRIAAWLANLVTVRRKLILVRNHNLLFPILIYFECLNGRNLWTVFVSVGHVHFGVHLFSLWTAPNLTFEISLFTVKEIVEHIFQVLHDGWLVCYVLRELFVEDGTRSWVIILLSVFATAFLDGSRHWIFRYSWWNHLQLLSEFVQWLPAGVGTTSPLWLVFWFCSLVILNFEIELLSALRPIGTWLILPEILF